MGRYDDIINCQRPQSKKHLPMPRTKRAAQFSPFAALTGYEAVTKETARITEERRELNEDKKAELDEKFRVLLNSLTMKPVVTLRYFVPDSRKAGGAYEEVQGIIRKIDMSRKFIWLESGEAIAIADIYEITIEKSN